RQRHRGLGLAIVERFCVDHQGRLKLLEAPGGGLRAELRLPVLMDQAPTPVPSATAPISGPESANT
ncbi:MAG: hypothetical protein VKK05_00385, partial [Synechococcus sp.]|nr:hypothetical protein [Synechococcus sp.]